LSSGKTKKNAIFFKKNRFSLKKPRFHVETRRVFNGLSNSGDTAPPDDFRRGREAAGKTVVSGRDSRREMPRSEMDIELKQSRRVLKPKMRELEIVTARAQKKTA